MDASSVGTEGKPPQQPVDADVGKGTGAGASLTVEELTGIIGSVTDHMSMLDENHNIVWANDIAKAAFGPDIVGRKCYQAYHGRRAACEGCIVTQTFLDGRIHEHETEVIGADGRKMTFWCTASVASMDATGKPSLVVEISRDITERKQLEDGLRRSQKIEAIGTFAGGMAHNFNNLLGIITGNLELAADEMGQDNPAHVSIQEARLASSRAKDMVRQILAFSRRARQAFQPIDIRPLVRKAVGILRFSLPKTIAVREEVALARAMILGDPDAVRQVVMNLLSNAVDAMEEAGDLLTVGLDRVDLDRNEAKRFPQLSPGRYVRLSVSDTGYAIEPETLCRVFDPYFTTKEVGKGTGMGLAVVHGIVQEHGGAVSAESEVGKGTTFHVFFPEL